MLIFLSFCFLIDLFLSSFCFQSMIGNFLSAAGGLEAITRARLKVENAEIVAGGRWEWQRNIFLFSVRYAFTDRNPIFPLFHDQLNRPTVRPVFSVEPRFVQFSHNSLIPDSIGLRNRISVRFLVFPIITVWSSLDFKTKINLKIVKSIWIKKKEKKREKELGNPT